MDVRAAVATDIAGIRRLLACANLPFEDLTAQSFRMFLVCHAKQKLIGAVAIEPCGTVGLLRSLTVAEEMRGQGTGARLLVAAEREAHRLQLRALYLLTTTAEDYFLKHSYRVIPREQAPVGIQRTAEFSTLCPSTSILLVKHLEG